MSLICLLLHQYIGVRRYPSFFDMLETESLGEVLPGIESVEEGTHCPVYR
jgi:ASC-1-like (ASCH) protein